MEETTLTLDGYGSGDGYGYGYGSGYGYGDGSGSGEKLNPVLVARVQLPAGLSDDPRTIALWKSASDGSPANGGRGTVARVGLVEEISGPLALCGPRALHATLQPDDWKGERLWIVALEGEVIGDANKMGALKREILAEVSL